jgi:hypothetical protein
LVIRVYPTQISTPENASIPIHMRATAQTGQPPPAPPYPNIIAAISSEPELCRADDPIFRRNISGGKSRETCEEGTFGTAVGIYGYSTVEVIEADDVSRR